MRHGAATIATHPTEREESFVATFDENQPRLFAVALRMMGNAEDAHDIVQESFISAYQHLEGLDESPNLVAWMYRIVTNKCLDALRARSRRPLSAGDEYGIAEWLPAPDQHHPERRLLDRELAERIEHVLAQMTPRYRRALMLRERDGYTIGEIASILGRSESATKSMLFRAREQFRELYELDEALESVPA